MSVSFTSKEAYDLVKKDLGDKQQRVYDAIEALGIASNEDIAEYLHWPINTVTPRCVELRKYGMVGFECLKKSKSGMTVKAWSVRDDGDNLLIKLIKQAEAA